MPMRSLFCVLFSVLFASLCLAGEPITTVIVGKKDPDFCTSQAKSVDFSCCAEETSVTMSLSSPRKTLTLQIHYEGDCVVWQYYRVPEDQILAKCEPDDECLPNGVRLQNAAKIELLRAKNAYSPFYNGITYRDRAVVFCGQVAPEQVRAFFFSRLSPDNITVKYAPPSDIEKLKESFSSDADLYDKNVKYVGRDINVPVEISDYFKIDRTGTFRVRFGYCIYPETTLNNFYAPLNQQEIIWSNAITLTVVP